MAIAQQSAPTPQFPWLRSPNAQGGHDFIYQPPEASKPAAISTVAQPGRNAQAVVSAAPDMGGGSAPMPINVPQSAPPAAPDQTQDSAPPVVGDGATAAPADTTAAPNMTSSPVMDYVSSFAGGVKSIDPNAPGLMQAAQGFGGAVDAREARSDRKLAAQLAANERRYQHDQDRLANSRADRALRDTEKHQRFEEGMSTTKEEREARSAQIADVSTAADIYYKQAETRKIANGYTADGFTFDQQKEIENQVIERAKLRKGQAGPFASISPPDEKQQQAEKDQMNADREELKQQFKTGGGDKFQGRPGEAVPKTAAPAAAGAGTWDSPITLPPGLTGDALRSAIQALPAGTILITPDGQKVERH